MCPGPDLGVVTEVPREILLGELLGLCGGFFRSAGPADAQVADMY
jgi:hypothetical protein